MRFLVITHVLHKSYDKQFWGYEPYVKEMNLWFKSVDEVVVIAPLINAAPGEIDVSYNLEKLKFESVPVLGFVNFITALQSLFALPFIFLKMLSEMRKADHIHLRCPGNMGLLGCMAQVFFPKKPKTAKYAGNWDPKAEQPWSYRLQKWLLSNEFLTRNMQVLVYGEWPEQSKNIKPFFTASYSRTKATITNPVFVEPYRFLFVGTLSKGKNPMYALKLIAALLKNGLPCRLDIYGEGTERKALEQFISENGMGERVILHGNQPAEIVETAYKESHFLLLPSKSEGWPKAVAEAMFWGVVPISTRISCVPWMLGFGKRGLLLTMDLENDVAHIFNSIANKVLLEEMAIEAQEWSQEYTLEKFETEIKALL